jgi:hypothetical protein
MKRISIKHMMRGAEETLSKLHNDESNVERRNTLMDIARYRLLLGKLDYLSGAVETFILKNNVIVVRQYVFNNNKVHWYEVSQADIQLIDNHRRLEDYYVHHFTAR